MGLEEVAPPRRPPWMVLELPARWIDGIKQQECEWDVIALQYVAMKSVEETWRYDQKSRDGCTLIWNGVAAWDTALSLGPQLTTTATNLEVRSARHSMVVAFRVEGQLHIVGNLHLPTQWHSERAFCDALSESVEKLRHFDAQGSTVTMLGDYTSEWPWAMTQQASRWARSARDAHERCFENPPGSSRKSDHRAAL